MAYVAVKGGERAIDAAHAWRAEARRGDPAIPALDTGQIAGQLGRAVERVMAEASLHDPGLAALAIRQAEGDLIEAAFLLRAFRTTLPRFGATLPLDTERMAVRRRISAIFKDVPGGQILGPTTGYTHRLLDFALLDADAPAPAPRGDTPPDAMPRVARMLESEGLLRPEPAADAAPFDLTREPLTHPALRDARLQALARGDEGFLLGMGYSTQRGYGGSHPFAGELRMGAVSVEIIPDELGFAIDIGEIVLTECQMVNQFAGSKTEPACFTAGYGLAFGQADRRAMAMALLDRAMQAPELGETVAAPAQNAEFVLAHADNIEATGFVEHLKLPHYVDFQSEAEAVRRLRAAAAAAAAEGTAEGTTERTK